jgi:spore coat protein H
MRPCVPFALAGVLALAGLALFWSPVSDASPANGAPLTADEPKKAEPPKKDPAAGTFGPDKVWQIHLSLTATEYEAMQPAQVGFGFPPPMNPPPKAEPKGDGKRETHRSVFGTEFPLAVAALSVDGKTVEKVGLRYKGNSTYLATARNLKRSLKVDIDRYDESARVLGQKTFNLHCGVMDATKGREALAYSIYRAAGVPAPRTAFAEVTLTVPGKYDKEFVGAYTLVENVDKNFLKLHYKTDKGLLMKPERVRGLDHLGDDWARYQTTYQPKREATKDESKRVIEFTKLVNQGTDAQFDKEIGSYLDVDAFLRFMAATALVSNLDSFFTIGHNYCLYLHPETNKFHFIPWDVDLSLGNFAFFGSADQQMDLSLVKPYAQNKLADRLMANKDVAARSQQILKEVVAVFNKDKLLAEIAVIEKTVKPLIEKEQKAVSARKEPASGFGPGFGAAPPDLKTFVEKRSSSIASQMAGTSKGYVPQQLGFGPPPARPLPGDVLPPNVQTQLQMTEDQKRKLAELQKQVDAELEKILTPEQRAQLKRLRDGPGVPPKKN